ncbi:MAG: Stp1/IreP family PP2C-type Ser/Thr phosphatase [Eubacteriaceae bacterium]|nr:Stp1/IreP family PP2C-type Ser/Thr phosphatase [Eubacteriaceae bacterium]
MFAYGKTHNGRLRATNEDRFICLKAGRFCAMAIADGMGGHNAGEVASKIAVDEIESYFLANPSIKGSLFDISTDIEKLIQTINTKIHEKSIDIIEQQGMGTTLILCVAENNIANIYHIGDCRAYFYNGQFLRQITKDHSLVQLLIDQGQLTKREAENHPRKNVITRALGTDEEVDVDIYTVVLSAGEKIMLCSDGLSNMVDTTTIQKVLSSMGALEAIDELVDLANANGGLDNITVTIQEMEEAV